MDGVSVVPVGPAPVAAAVACFGVGARVMVAFVLELWLARVWSRWPFIIAGEVAGCLRTCAEVRTGHVDRRLPSIALYQEEGEMERKICKVCREMAEFAAFVVGGGVVARLHYGGVTSA